MTASLSEARPAAPARSVALPSARRLLLWTGLAVLLAWVLVPIYFVALGAFGGRLGVFKWPKSVWPGDLSLAPMMQFLAIEGVFNALVNSLIAAGLTVVFSVALGAPAGYALARYNFPGQNAYRLLVLLTRAFPLAILALPLTVSFIRLGLYDTPFGVSLIHTVLALPFAALVTQSLFMGIPREYEEAAWVFGCTRFQAFRLVVIPVMWPGVVTTGLFSFLLAYNDFAVTAMLLTQDNQTIIPKIASFLGSTQAEGKVMYAVAAVVSSIAPLFVLVLFFQKQIVSGLTAGAVKG